MFLYTISRNSIIKLTAMFSRSPQQCLPAGKSPMPQKLQKMLAFLKCNKKKRFTVCMKHDFKKHLDFFDTSAIQKEDEDDSEAAEKLIHVMWGLENNDDFQLY